MTCPQLSDHSGCDNKKTSKNSMQKISMECGTACNNVKHFWWNSARIMPKSEKDRRCKTSWGFILLRFSEWSDIKWCARWSALWPHDNIMSFTENSGQTCKPWNQKETIWIINVPTTPQTHKFLQGPYLKRNDICLISSDCVKWGLKTNQRFNLITTSRDPSDYVQSDFHHFFIRIESLLYKPSSKK